MWNVNLAEILLRTLPNSCLHPGKSVIKIVYLKLVTMSNSLFPIKGVYLNSEILGLI